MARNDNIDLEGKLGVRNDASDVHSKQVSIHDVAQQAVLGPIVEYFGHGVLLGDRGDLEIVLFIGLAELLRTEVIDIEKGVQRYLAIRLDCVTDDKLGLLVGFVNDILDVRLLSVLGLFNRDFLHARVVGSELLETELDLLKDLLRDRLMEGAIAVTFFIFRIFILIGDILFIVDFIIAVVIEHGKLD